MSPGVKLALWIAAAAVLFLGSAAALVFIVWSGLTEEHRAQISEALIGRADLAVFVAALLVAGLGIVVRGLFEAYVVATRRLAEETRLIAGANPDYRVTVSGAAEVKLLARDINALADRCRALKDGTVARAAESNRDLERERNRLAALMSELTQSVLVCNLEGRILLHNQRALELLGAPVDARDAHNHGAMVGLGRSLFGIMDRNVVLHALELVQASLQRDEARPVVGFAAAIPGGRLIRAQMAPVLATPEETDADVAKDGANRISGFVLTLENIQYSVESAGRRNRLLQSLTEGTRASLANIRAAIETMLAFPEMEPARRLRFEGVIQDEARTLSERLDAATAEYAGALRTEWPLETMSSRDLAAAIQRNVESKLDLSVVYDGPDDPVWLAVDSYSLVRAITGLAALLKNERDVRRLRLRFEPEGRQVRCDLIWDGAPLSSDVAARWQRTAVDLGGEEIALNFDEVIARHGGEAWHQADAGSGTARFRMLLCAPPHRGAAVEFNVVPNRPVFYDFDLFHQPGQRPELDRCTLNELSYTVFDTETTGLEPSAGDEIIAIGAVRIVNGRLLHGDAFEQLIDPKRPVRPESIRIHGIPPAILAGQPTIDRVLPRFHRFCEDTVLIAHNAAFDMRFLQLKESPTGVRFTQPVLDTLLLSAVAQPNQREHHLDAMAARLGVNVIGRHTALGDAIVTAEVFLKLIPLLAAQGVHTLKDAREASARTSYARLKY